MKKKTLGEYRSLPSRRAMKLRISEVKLYYRREQEVIMRVKQEETQTRGKRSPEAGI